MGLFAVLSNEKLVRENRTMKNYKIAVAGTGYVGLSLGVLLSQHHQVVAVDIVQAKVDMINNKKSPIQDDYIEKYLAEKDLNLTATLDKEIKKPTNFDEMLRIAGILSKGMPEVRVDLYNVNLFRSANNSSRSL